MNPRMPILAAGRAHDHFVFHHQRGMRDGIAGFRLGDGRIPQRLPVLGIDGDQMRVDGAHEQRVAQDRQPAIDAAAAGARRLRHRKLVGPEDPSGGGIESDHVVGSLDRVHDPVHHQRRGFELLERSRLIDPLQFQVLHVLRSDLRERAMTLAHSGTGVGQPVLRLLVGAQDAIEGNLGEQRTRDGKKQQQRA